jgi:RNAse (barnase) inhibitor barstar
MQGFSALPSSGVWKLNARPDTAMALVEIACLPPANKHNLLAALAKALQLPADFGMNWDAAWDCLNDPHWMVQRGFTLALSEAMPVDADALSTFLDIFSEACDAWRDQGQNLLLAVITTREDLSCIQTLANYPGA